VFYTNFIKVKEPAALENNPIDKDKITETPHLLPYAHHVGGFVIKPLDKGRIKGRAMEAMVQQTEMQLKQLYGQMETLAKQAVELRERAEISYRIYEADMNFQPLVGHTYFLYERADGLSVLSMIASHEWGKKMPYARFLAEVKLLADHTWEVKAASVD
jgi:hypothetical protein